MLRYNKTGKTEFNAPLTKADSSIFIFSEEAEKLFCSLPLQSLLHLFTL